jgi:hypothetical protein
VSRTEVVEKSETRTLCPILFSISFAVSEVIKRQLLDMHMHLRTCILNNQYWLYILSFIFRQTQRYTNQLTHISLCIIEFIGRTMSLHVSAHGAILRRYINNLILLNYAFYMDPYISLPFL